MNVLDEHVPAEQRELLKRRRLLRHPRFDTRAKRMGAVIRVSPRCIRVWRPLVEQESRIDWA